MKKTIYSLIALVIFILFGCIFIPKDEGECFKPFNANLKKYNLAIDIEEHDLDILTNSINENPQYIDFIIENYQSSKTNIAYKDVSLYLFCVMAKEKKIPDSKIDSVIKFFKKCMNDDSRVLTYGGRKGKAVKRWAATGLMNLANNDLLKDFIMMIEDGDDSFCIDGALGLLKLKQEDKLFNLLITKDKSVDWDIKTIYDFLAWHDEANKANKFKAFNLRIKKYIEKKDKGK